MGSGLVNCINDDTNCATLRTNIQLCTPDPGSHTRMRALRVLKIVLSVALLLAMQAYAETNKEKVPLPSRTNPVPRIDGYGLYRFGMLIEQARKVRPDAEKTDCQYTGTAYCLTQVTQLFGQDARIDALFDSNTKRLSKINITFERIEGKERACVKVLEAVVMPLLQKWGTPTREDEASFYWESPYGGSVSLLRLCVSDDMGIVVVTYSDTPGF